MRFSIISLVAILASTFPFADAKPDSSWPPRLLAATQGGRTMLLLPESHTGLQSQYDRYFELVIKPAFLSSSRLLVERPEEIQLAEDIRYKSCPNEAVSEREVDAEINAVLAEVAPKTIWGRVPAPAPLEHFSRFMRTELLFDVLYYRKADPDRTAMEHPRVKPGSGILPGYAWSLMNDSPRPYTSVDTPQSMFRVYCDMAPAARNDFAHSLLKLRQEVLDARRRGGDSMDAVAELHRVYRVALNHTLAAVQGDNPISTAAVETPEELQIGRFLLAGRNREWISSLPSLTSNERLPFMIIGAAHFPDTAAGPGLVHLLRDAGYHLSVVQNRAALALLLNKLPPVRPHQQMPESKEWIVEKLDGKCVAVGSLRLCGWNNGRVLLHLTDTGGELSSLHYCSTRPTAWGKRSSCSDIRVPSSLITSEWK